MITLFPKKYILIKEYGLKIIFIFWNNLWTEPWKHISIQLEVQRDLRPKEESLLDPEGIYSRYNESFLHIKQLEPKEPFLQKEIHCIDSVEDAFMSTTGQFMGNVGTFFIGKVTTFYTAPFRIWCSSSFFGVLWSKCRETSETRVGNDGHLSYVIAWTNYSPHILFVQYDAWTNGICFCVWIDPIFFSIFINKIHRCW